MKIIIILLIGLILIVGCNPDKIVDRDGEYLITRDGQRFCAADFTEVSFDNTEGFVQYRGHFSLDISSETKNDGVIVFHPEEELTICKQRNIDTGDCENITAKVILPCSWCVRLTEDYEVIDEGKGCMGSQIKEIIESREW